MKDYGEDYVFEFEVFVDEEFEVEAFIVPESEAGWSSGTKGCNITDISIMVERNLTARTSGEFNRSIAFMVKSEMDFGAHNVNVTATFADNTVRHTTINFIIYPKIVCTSEIIVKPDLIEDFALQIGESARVRRPSASAESFDLIPD